MDGIDNQHKFRHWFSNHWNKIEGLCILLFIIGFVLHSISPHEKYNKYANIFYSVVLFFFTMKLLQMFSLNKKIGVYVVMLQKMVGTSHYLWVRALYVGCQFRGWSSISCKCSLICLGPHRLTMYNINCN